MALLRLRLGRAYAAKDDPCVLRCGDGREDGDCAQQPAAQKSRVNGRPHLLDQHDSQADDLHQGVQLAQQAGAEVAQGAGGKEQGGDEQDSKVAAEDQHGDIARHQVHVGEDEKQRAEQELVGDGVEILAEASALGEPSSEQAVEAVAEACQHEQRKCQAVPPVQNRDHQKRDDEQAQQREQVGSGAELAQIIHRLGARPS